MITRKSTRRKMGLVSVALVASIIMQWLIIPEIKFDNAVNADDLPYVPDQIDSANLVNYETILGGAVDYGIVANTYTQINHTETPFAVNYFYANGSQVDVDYITSTAHFIIGRQLDGFMRMSGTRATSIHFEAPQSVFGYYNDGTPVNYTQIQNSGIPLTGKDQNNGWGHIAFMGEFNKWVTPEPSFIQSVNDSAYVNVDRLLNRIGGDDGRSVFINGRCQSNSGFVLNPDGDNCGWFGGDSGRGTPTDQNGYNIYLNNSSFANSVVYINATSSIVQALKVGGLKIHKLPSTVVVFNFSTDLNSDILNSELKEPKLTVYEENNPSTVLYSQFTGKTASNGGDFNDSEKINKIEEQFNERIIWNFMTPTSADQYIRFNDFAGVVLAPYAKVKFNGHVTGWFVANEVYSENELHFLYNGGSNDGYGQMHFSVRKGFVESLQSLYTTSSPEELKNVVFNGSDIVFNWQEYEDADYTIARGAVVTVSPSRTSVAQFPTLDFATDTSPHYVAPPTGDEPSVGEFYFKITEAACNNIPGVSQNDGYIAIKLTVTRDTAGNFSYGVEHRHYCNPDDDRPYYEKTVNRISGIQFDLGAFYNEVTSTVSQLTVTKKITGPTLDPTVEHTYYFVVSSERKFYYKDDAGNWQPSDSDDTITSDNVFTVTTHGNTGTTTLLGLPADKTYVVTEVVQDSSGAYVAVSATNTPSSISGYTFDYNGSHPIASNITFDTATPPKAEAELVNNYSIDTGSLAIQKVISGVTPAAGQTFTFTIYNSDATGAQGEVYTTIPVTVAAESTESPVATITGVPTGYYLVVETSHVDEIDGYTYSSVAYTGGTGENNNLVNVTTTATTPVQVTATNTYGPTQTYGSLAIQKVISGVTPAAGQTFTFTIYNSDATGAQGEVYTTIPVTVAAGSTESPVATITDVPTGYYLVVETSHVDEIDGYTYSSVAYTGGTGENNNLVNVTTTATTPVQVTATNTYGPTQTYGYIKVVKTLTGITLDLARDINFTVTGVDGIVIPTLNSAAVTAGTWTKDGNTYTYVVPTAIAVGTHVTVSETEPASPIVNGNTTYTLEQAPAAVTVIITEGTQATAQAAAFTNTYSSTTPTPTGGETTPTPTGGETTPTPTGGETTPTPTDSETTPTPTDSETTPTPTDGVTTPTPTDGTEPTPTDDVTTPTPTDETEPSTTPGPDDGGSGPVYGSIIISKSLIGAPLNELDNIVFVLTDTSCGATREVPALNMENVSSGLWGDAGNGSYYFIVTGLTPGVTYTVAETIDGHTTVYALVAESSTTTGSATVVANSSVDVSMVNVYTSTLEPTVTPEPSETVPSETVPTDDTTASTDDNDLVDNANRSRNTVDSTDRSVSATGETSVNIVAAVIMLFALVLVFTARKLREEAKKND